MIIDKMKILLFVCLLSVIFIPVIAQNNTIEKLIKLSDEENDDLKKIDIYYKISMFYYVENEYEKALIYAKKGLDLSNEISSLKEQLKFLKHFGDIYYISSNYYESISYYKRVNALADQYNIIEYTAKSYQGLSKNYWKTGKFKESVYFGTEAIKYFEKNNDTLNITMTKGNLGAVYLDIGEYKRAERIFNEILIVYEDLSDTLAIANVYGKKGIIKFYQSYYPYARKYYNKAYQLYTEINKELEAAVQLGNIAETYEMEKDYSKAINKYSEAISIEKKYNYYSGLIFLYQALGRSYYKLRKYSKAKESYFISLKYIKKTGEYRELPNLYKLLHELYEKYGDYKNAYYYSEKLNEVKDSISGADVRNKINDIRIKYESEKKEKQNESFRKNQILQDKINTYQKEENRKLYFLLLSVILFTILIVISAAILYRFFKKNKKTGNILAEKNDELNWMYKDITDSISYAGNIQKALLRSFKEVTVNFSGHFIFYEPAHILSGDFYWSKKINDTIFIAVADSTGHGIPGALISILGMSYLNEIVNKDYIQTDIILNNLRDKIKKSLNQKGEYGEQKDGWDISICSINIKTGESNYSGAFNSMYIVSNKLKENPEEKHFRELKADRQPVSIYLKEHPFSKQAFNLKKGDIIYLFTDGFSDQLNEIEGKKFTSKRFRKLLLSVSRDKPEDQKSLIEETFNSWKGKFDQVDDVLVVGIEI